MKKVMIAAITSLFISSCTPAFAASFDCNKASTNAEKMVCSNPVLSAMDEALAAQYRQTPASDELRATQREWIKEQRKITDSDAMLNHYMKRIEYLKQVANNTQPAPKQEQTKPEPKKQTTKSDEYNDHVKFLNRFDEYEFHTADGEVYDTSTREIPYDPQVAICADILSTDLMKTQMKHARKVGTLQLLRQKRKYIENGLYNMAVDEIRKNPVVLIGCEAARQMGY